MDNLFFIYLGVIAIAILAGFYKLRMKDTASKILLALLCVTLLSEITTHWAALKYHNNMFVYHFFSPVQLIIICTYFDNILLKFKKRRVGVVIGVLAAIAAGLNTMYFQSLNILNSNFLLLEGLIIMALALYTFQLILSNDNINIYHYGHFWIIVILIFFWSVTYTWWALYTVMQEKERHILSKTIKILWSVNVITYAAIGFVFLYFSRNQKQLTHE